MGEGSMAHSIHKKISTYNLAAEFSTFLIIVNRKCKLAVADQSANLGKKIDSFLLFDKFSGLSGFSGLVPNRHSSDNHSSYFCKWLFLPTDIPQVIIPHIDVIDHCYLQTFLW